MAMDPLSNDRVISSLKHILDKFIQKNNIEVLSIVLYGSKARGDRSSQSDYEILVFLKDDVSVYEYIMFNEALKLELIKEKLLQVKILTYTPEAFEKLLYNDNMVGTILYIICKENIVLYDRYGSFTAIKERITRSDIKDEEKFLNQCIEFARMMGSEKWERKWEKSLLQYKYSRKRRSN